MSTEITDIAVIDNQSLQTRSDHINHSLLSKENFSHYLKVAEFLSKSSLVPKNMQGKPSDILIAMEMGLQIGIPMMQAIQDIAVINGKPCMYGDGLLAVVQGHKDYEWIKEEIVNDDGDKRHAVCAIKRKNHDTHIVRFSVELAKKAALWNKPGTWTQYPDRMLQMRARGFCLRDIFSDALRGIKTVEEVSDHNDSQKESKPFKDSKLMDKIKAAKGLVIDVEPTQMANNTVLLATNDDLEEIEALLAVKVFDESRIKGAMSHYKVESFDNLTSDQAKDFIDKLHKCADKD